MAEWSVEDAKRQFSDLVNEAMAGKPQLVTQRGQLAVVVLSVEEFDRLHRMEDSGVPTFGELLLEIPQDGDEFESLPIETRPFNL